mgnify:FL=1
MKKPTSHPSGCMRKDCWIDGEGTEWHPGSYIGVYAVTAGETYLLSATNVSKVLSLTQVYKQQKVQTI